MISISDVPRVMRPVPTDPLAFPAGPPNIAVLPAPQAPFTNPWLSAQLTLLTNFPDHYPIDYLMRLHPNVGLLVQPSHFAHAKTKTKTIGARFFQKSQKKNDRNTFFLQIPIEILSKKNRGQNSTLKSDVDTLI